MRDESSRSGAPMDGDLSLKGIVITTIGLAALLVVSAAVVWPLVRGFKEMVVSADPPPPALPEARIQQLPPEPRLQADPVADMDALRAEETRLLGSWEWVDEASGRARVPIERAMEILVERGIDPAEPVPADGPAGDGESRP